ncbi:hypothetical protein HGRIS_005453 [Hohenbuehelia grisea]|uniref:Uncharacterized protein n=1 Tax=Hohenbuehelia grisea TaxID=104357 RepID=A0ABR3JY03_9AGAR
MTLKFTAALVALVAGAVMASPNEPTRTTALGLIDPPLSSPLEISSLLLAPRRLTNAQRLARGLTPNPPVRRGARTGEGVVRRQNPSALPPIEGAIRFTCEDEVAGVPAGGEVWLEKLPAGGGVYDATGASADSLTVTIPDGAVGPVDMITTNDAFTGTLPNVVGIPGVSSANNDLPPGTDNYAYITASNPTPPGSPPVRQPSAYTVATGREFPVESSIWQVDRDNDYRITPIWVNTDGSTNEVHFVYLPGSSAFALVGDVDVFRTRNVPTIECQANFVPI